MYTTNSKLSKLIANKLNLKVTKSLGTGGSGEAFLLKDGRVMKITESQDEYHTSTERIGKFHPNICQIFETYRVTYKDVERFAIIQERLNTTCRDELAEFEEETDMENVARKLVKDSDNKYSNDKLIKLEKDKFIVDNYWDFVKMYLMLVEASINIGIKNSDLFSGNIGKRAKSKEWVLFDLGYCENHLSSEGKELDLTPEYVIPKGDELTEELLNLKREHGSALIREAGLVYTYQSKFGGYRVNHMTLGGMLKQKVF